MAEPSDLQLPPPNDWQRFERWLRDLLEAEWGPPVEMHGRTGQPQHGVDIYGQPKGERGHWGVQCKLHDALLNAARSAKELEAEAAKAEEFEPKIAWFIFATTGPRDRKLQAAARKLTARKKAAFPVEVWFWADILNLYDKHRDVFAQHYPRVPRSDNTGSRSVAANRDIGGLVVTGDRNTVQVHQRIHTAHPLTRKSGWRFVIALVLITGVLLVLLWILKDWGSGRGKKNATGTCFSAQGAVDAETLNLIVRRYEANLQERDNYIAGMRTSLGERDSLVGDLRAVLARVQAEAEKGDPLAAAAIKEARRSGDIQKLQAALIIQADRQGPAYAQLCRSIANVAYIRGDIDEAQKRLEIVLRLLPGDVDALLWIGNIHLLRGNIEAARGCYEEVLRRCGDDQRWKAMALGNLGVIHRKKGDLRMAEEMTRQSLATSELLGRQEGIARQCVNLGLIYRMRGDPKKAEEMTRKALAIYVKLGRVTEMAIAYGNLGVIYQDSGDLNQAEEMHSKALAIEEKLGRQEGVASEYGNLGLIYRARGDLGRAEQMTRKSVVIEEKLGHHEGMASDYGNLGNIYAERGDLDTAEQWVRRALDIEVKLANQEGIARAHQNLGVIGRRRGDVTTARVHWLKARDLYVGIGMPREVKQIQGWLDGLPPLASNPSPVGD